MTNETKHTPTPWYKVQEFANRWAIEYRKDGFVPLSLAKITITCCEVSGGKDEENSANAAFIVRACNSHDDLVAALEKCVEALKDASFKVTGDICPMFDEPRKDAEAVLAKAKAGE